MFWIQTLEAYSDSR